MTQLYINDAEHMHLTCDSCPTKDEFDGTFENCIDMAKQDGWRFKYHDGEWYHFCSGGCAKKL